MSGVDFNRGMVRSPPLSPQAGEVGRLGDIVISLAMLLFLAPVLAAVALAAMLLEGGPLFAASPRIGLRGREFQCLRFRAATAPDADARLDAFLGRNQWGRSGETASLTPVGRFLRLSGLDNAPQFLNVLRGDMSIVGPAPISPAETVRYGRRLSSYCSVRPGVTGLWQLRGRSGLPFRRRVAMDVLYVRKKSALLDLALILEAIPTAIMRPEPNV